MFAVAATLNESPLTLWVFGGCGVLLFFWCFAVTVQRRTRVIGALVIGALAIGSLAILAPRKSMKTDGGTEFSLRLLPLEDENGTKQPITKKQVNQAIGVLEKRLKAMKVRDAHVTPQGDSGILVQIPGVTAETSQPLKSLLKISGKLELREVHPRNDEANLNGKTLAARVEAGNEIVPGYKAYTYQHKDADGNPRSVPILLNRRAALGGQDIELATPSPQQPGAVSISLNDAGTDKMIALTQNMTPQRDRIAIVLDGVVISAPVVNQVPLGKNFIVEGLREAGEVQSLASALMCPLEMPLVIEDERTLPPPQNL